MTAHTFYHFDGDPADEVAWQAFVAEHREPSAYEQNPVTTNSTISSVAVKRLTELFLLFVVVVALVGTVIWQKSTTQIAAQKAELQQLQAQLATATAPQRVPAAASIGRTEDQIPELHIFETEHLRFVVETGNVEIVLANTLSTERSYCQIWEDLQLDPITNVDKQIIYVTNSADGRSTVPYDALGVINIDMSTYTEPVTGTTGDAAQEFQDDLLYRLAQRAFDEVLHTKTIKAKWNVVIESLYRHMAHDPEWYPPTKLKSYEIEKRYLAQMYPLKTVELTLGPGNWIYPDRTVADAVADALVEYIFVTYGRDTVPQFLDALAKYDDLDQVIPSVFAIPAEQFTTEWHTYLRLHYPIEAGDATDDIEALDLPSIL